MMRTTITFTLEELHELSRAIDEATGDADARDAFLCGCDGLSIDRAERKIVRAIKRLSEKRQEQAQP